LIAAGLALGSFLTVIITDILAPPESSVIRIGGWTLAAAIRPGLLFFLLLGLFMLGFTIIIISAQAKQARQDSPLSKSINFPAIQYNLEGLLSKYRDALMFVDQLPLIRRWPCSARDFPLSDDDRWIRPFWGGVKGSKNVSKQPVVRPFVRLFVETHIRRQLIAINRRLELERLTIDDSREYQGRLEPIRAHISGNLNTLFGWSRIRRVVQSMPWLPIALGASTAVVAAITGTDKSGKEYLTSSALSAVRSHNWTTVLWGALGIAFWASVVFYCLYLLVVPIVATGYNVKKAIFAGGGLSFSEWMLFVGPPYYYMEWQGFPKEDIYAAEQEVFRALGIRRKNGFQVDLVFAFFPYLMCTLAALCETVVIRTSWGWAADASLQTIPLFLLLVAIDQRRMYQRRRVMGHA
jgi:hypothetical protein